jgi:hypothetical protein
MLLATALDPRFKLDFFEDEEVKNRARQLLLEEAEAFSVKIYGLPVAITQNSVEVEETETMTSRAMSMLETFRAAIRENSEVSSQEIPASDLYKKAEVVCL